MKKTGIKELLEMGLEPTLNNLRRFRVFNAVVAIQEASTRKNMSVSDEDIDLEIVAMRRQRKI